MTTNSRLPSGPLSRFIRKLNQEYTFGEMHGVLGLSDREISRYITGQYRTVKLTTVDRICCAAGVHIGQLYPEYYE